MKVTDFKLSDRVYHNTMGLGRVAAVQQGRDRDEIWVAYDNGGEGRYGARWFELLPDRLTLFTPPPTPQDKPASEQKEP